MTWIRGSDGCPPSETRALGRPHSGSFAVSCSHVIAFCDVKLAFASIFWQNQSHREPLVWLTTAAVTQQLPQKGPATSSL